METTLGRLLGGRVVYAQPRVGFRSGIEPVLLAAAVPVRPGERVLEAGTGAGATLLCLGARVPDIDAVGVEQNAALAQLAGGLARPLKQLRDQLLDLLAHLEAGFDFADEDIAFLNPEELALRLDHAADALEKIRAQLHGRSHADHKPRVVLVGRPNVGKSSLFNALAGAPRAIVSPQAGTTRDYLIAELDLDGVRCELVDTAGMALGTRPCDPEGEIAAAAQAAARRQAQQATVELFCLDSTQDFHPWEQQQLASARRARLLVLTKIDAPRRLVLDRPAIETSALTGKGLAELKAALRAKLVESGTPEARKNRSLHVLCNRSQAVSDIAQQDISGFETCLPVVIAEAGERDHKNRSAVEFLV